MTTSASRPRRRNTRSVIFLLVLVAGLSVPLHAQTFKPINPLFFTKPFAGPNPLPQILAVSSNTGADFGFSATASTSTGGAWLSVPIGTCYSTPATLQVIVNAPVALPAGTYNGQVAFTAAGVVTLTVPVTLVISAPGTTFFDNMPGGLTFSAKPSVTSFTSQQIQVRNGGSGALSWTVTASTFNNGDWLTISSASGTAPALVTVGINAAN